MSTGNTPNVDANAGKNLLALPEGVQLGHYHILRSIGQGGFGITYLAKNHSNGEKVVIKENLPTFCAMRDRTTLQVTATNPDDEFREYTRYLKRFVDEAKLLAQLNHPNIVKVLDAFEALGTAYYVMPWVGGRELHKAAPAPADITEAWLRPILSTLLHTLEYLHGLNIYHRDVKPANILLTESDMPVLIDFGTARAIISERSSTMVGSPGYTPIEQMTAKGKRGPWTDVYSLGATCYRLITGERPPEANERLAEEEDTLHPLANRSDLLTRFSEGFLSTIDKALALRGKDRWQTAAEWLAALTESASLPPLPAGSDNSKTDNIKTSPSSTPRPRSTVAIFLLILLLILGITGGYMTHQHSKAEAEQRLLEQREAERKAREEAERKAREEAERKAKEEAERKAKEEAERKAREEAERKAKEEAERRAQEEEAKRKAWVEAELKAKAEAERKAKEEAERKTRAEAERKAKVEAKRKIKEDARRRLSEMGIPESEYNSKIFEYLSFANKEKLALLITAGADVNTVKDGVTPLTEAACNYNCQGGRDILTLLLSAPGIDVNKVDRYGMTALNWAAYQGFDDCVQLLLDVPGINVNKADNDGETPLHRALRQGSTRCLGLLLAAPGIDVNKGDLNGESPLFRAVRNCDMAFVAILLETPGIDVNKKNKKGETPLKVAEILAHPECGVLIETAGGKM